MRVLIIGGTGALSTRIVEESLDHGDDVAIVTRGKRAIPAQINGRVTPIVMPREEMRGSASRLRDFSPEAVIDCICFKPDDAQSLVDVFPHVRRLIMISSVDVYGEDVLSAPITEQQQPNPASQYGKDKLICERMLLDRFGGRVTLFRPSHILGRGFLTTSVRSRTPYLVDRIARGKPILAFDGGRNIMTPVYAGDVAKWVRIAIDNQASGAEAFNAVGGAFVTQEQYYRTIASILGKEVRLLSVPSRLFRTAFPAFTQLMSHRIYSCRKAVDVLGHSPQVGFEAMLHETVTHMIEHGLVRDCTEDTFEDRLAAMLERSEEALRSFLRETAAEQRA